MQYDVQYYNNANALWTTLRTYDMVTPAVAEYERLVEIEHDHEISYRVVQTEIINVVVRQS